MTAAPGPRPHTAELWDEREAWPRERIAEYQLERLREQLAYVQERSPFYRARFAEAGLEPGDLRSLDDLRALPLTDKAAYWDLVREAPPWGIHLAAAPEDVRRVHFSSGTTSKPVPCCWTAEDLDRWADLYARVAYAQGVRPGDVYQCLFNFSWFVGGLGAIAGYQRLGATCIPAGSGDSERQVDTIFAYGTTVVGATPSFAAHLADVARQMGRDLRESRVERIMVGGEPGGAIPASRRRIEEAWGAKCFDGYGLLEFQPVAWECEERSGGHLAEDFLYAEVLDPATRQPVPDGEPGVLVLTHLDKRAHPLVRWWTGDVVVRDASPCPCGRTHARLPGGVRGRVDDMLIVRGVNVFPSAIEEVVRRAEGTTGEYQIVLDDEVRDANGYLTTLKLRVEGEPAARDLGERLAAAVHEELRFRPLVEVLPPSSLPRVTHKARRIVTENGRR